MNPIRLTLQIVLPLLIVGGGYFAMEMLAAQREEPEAAEPVVPRPLVDAIAVAPVDLDLRVEAQGTVVPRTSSNLVAEVSGRLIYVSPNLVNGGFVEAGEALIRIDERDYELAVAQARLAVAQAERRLEEERADAEVAREEWAALGKGEPSALTLREPQVAEAEASLDAARASLERAMLDLERTEVVAPFPARVREKRVDLGEYVTRGQTLATGYGTDFAEVRLPLPDTELEFLDVPLSYAKSAEPGPEVTLWTEFAGERHSWTGRIVRTEGEIDPRTRMIVAIVEVADPYAVSDDSRRAPLAVGMFVNAEIVGRTLHDVVVIPRSAMRGRDTVYTVDDRNRLHIRTIRVARRGADQVVVAGGIPTDERVIISPIEVVTEKMRVRVEGDPDPVYLPSILLRPVTNFVDGLVEVLVEGPPEAPAEDPKPDADLETEDGDAVVTRTGIELPAEE